KTLPLYGSSLSQAIVTWEVLIFKTSGLTSATTDLRNRKTAKIPIPPIITISKKYILHID
ncbi:MAG: hypothetical protein ACYSQZ_02810, partial [Planctomycetota bacterium]